MFLVYKKLLRYITNMGFTYQRLKAEKPNYMVEHSKSVSKYLTEKYKNDEEFRERKKAYQREYRRRKKEEKLTNLQHCENT